MDRYKDLFIQFTDMDGDYIEIEFTSSSDKVMFDPEQVVRALFREHNAKKVFGVFVPEKCIVCGNGMNQTAQDLEGKWLDGLNKELGGDYSDK